MAFALNQLRSEYDQLFNTCTVSTAKLATVDKLVNQIIQNKARYEDVSARTGVPWQFIGLTHCMECSLKFNQHLHNGDPLTARTKQVPAGRPVKGTPPFTWEDSAEDALRFEELDKWTDWSIPGMLFKLEAYNGFGSRSRGIRTPYLWSFSNHYTKGKFVKDGVFDPEAVSQQVGAAVLLRRLEEKGFFTETRPAPISEELKTQIGQVGETVTFNPQNFNAAAQQLQRLLNKAGNNLLDDGKAGKKTSEAYQVISGQFLKGDPRRQS